MSAGPTIAVLIACHDRRATTLACLKALADQQVDASLHVMLFDDGSRDGTGAAVRDAFPAVEIRSGRGDAFWAGGMRALFDEALTRGFDHYLWLNDDVALRPDALARLLAVAHQLVAVEPGPVLVGGAVADPVTGAFAYGGIGRRAPRLAPLRFVRVPPSPTQTRHCHTLHGNVVLIPRRTSEAVGSLGRAYIHGLADLDYGLRVTGQGGIVALAPGYVGTCARNPRALAFFGPATSLGDRWRHLADPLGFPLRPWLAFARVHGGPLWPLFAVLPFWRLLVPTALLHGFRRMTPRVRPA